MLYNKFYVNGSFKREELKGTFSYERFSNNEIYIDRAKGNDLVMDTLAPVEASDPEGYLTELRNLFSDFDLLSGYTDEEVLGRVYSLRRRYFAPSYYKRLRDERREKIRMIMEGEAIGRDSIISTLAYSDEKNPSYRAHFERDEMLLKALDGERIALLCSTVVELSIFLTYARTLDNLSELTVFIKEDQVKEEPTPEEVEELSDLYPQLKDMDIKYLRYENRAPGMDLQNISKEVEDTLEEVVKGRVKLFVLGEDQIFSLVDSRIPYYIISKIRERSTQIYANSFLKSDRMIPYLTTYVEGGYRTAIKISGVDRVGMNLEQYDKIFFSSVNSHRSRDNLLLDSPENLINLYSSSFSKENFEDVLPCSMEKDLLKRREEMLNGMIGREIRRRGLEYIDLYYSYDEKRCIEYKPVSEEEENAVLVRGIRVGDTSKISLDTILAEEYDAGILSIRELIERREVPSGFQLYNNLLYFFTNNLLNIYNTVREDRPREQLKFKDFYLDYRYFKDGGREYFPLYSKGYIGFKEGRGLTFGRMTLRGGRIELGDTTLKWSEDQVDNLEKDFTIITPMYLKEETGDKAGFRSYRRILGEDRLNIVIVNNRIVSIRDGGVVAPSIGVILSFADKSDIVERLSLESIGDGYYSLPDLDIRLDLDKTKDEGECDWILGGGTLLVREGVSLVEDEGSAYENFRGEGWYNPLSMQTQETQVQDWVRGPRSVIGTTKAGEMFIVTFSGRSLNTAGARFDEVVEIISSQIGEIEDLMNLDGGASVCFGAIFRDEFFELNLPAPSEFNVKGMVRPVNSMILLGVKDN